jgi:hypothetical protein
MLSGPWARASIAQQASDAAASVSIGGSFDHARMMASSRGPLVAPALLARRLVTHAPRLAPQKPSAGPARGRRIFSV